MLTFNDGVLKCRKIDVPDVPISAVMDIQKSYTQYVTETIYDDMEYLETCLQRLSGLKGIKVRTVVKPIVEHDMPIVTTVSKNRYIPVMAEFYLPGSNHPVKAETEIVRIPAMHDFGKFNFEGKLKVVMSQLRATDSVSYDSNKRTLNITMPKVNLRIRLYKSDIAFVVKQKRVPVFPILCTMLDDIGDKTPIDTYIQRAQTLALLGFKTGMRTEHYAVSTRMHGGLYNSLSGEAYVLGESRLALNKALMLERGIGQQLAEECIGYPRGYVVDNKFIADAYMKRINHYLVRDPAFAGGYWYAGQNPIYIGVIPKGMKNTSYLRQMLPQYRSLTYFEEDVELAEPILIEKWHVLTADEMELIYACGYTRLPVSTRKNGSVFIYSFVHEIVGNYVAKLSQLVDNVPDGRSADEDIYYYNNDALLNSDDKLQHITAHDLLAIVSLLGDIAVNGNTDLHNRDTSFLKGVAMVNELFSESLRSTIREYTQMSKTKISNYIYGKASALDNTNPFIGMTSRWYSTMSKRNITATVDAMNLMAEISQACHITTPDNGSGEILDEQRDIAVPYYSRLCPFETPAGFKLGTVNTRALGSKIENGILKAPYRKVLRAGNSIKISDTIVWLSPAQEMENGGHKFASLLSFKQRPDGTYENNKILARVPNPDRSDEPFTFKNIYAYEMAGHYVDAFPEQSISPATSLVPFACSNDAIRLSYGISQIKQGVLLHNSQKSRVRTPMHTQMFDFYNNCYYYSPCNGTVTEIVLDQYIAIKDSADGSIRKVNTTNVNQSASRLLVPSYHVKVGDAVKAEQLICTGVLHPTSFVVRAPMSGYVTHISRTSIEIMKSNNAAIPGRPVDIREEEPTIIPLYPFRKIGTNAVFLNIKCAVGQYVKEGEILADTYTSRDGVYSPARCPLTAFVPTGYNYEDGIHATERASVAYTSMLATTLKHREYRGKSGGAMPIKIPADFSYHSKGEVVTQINKYQSGGDKEVRTANVIATAKSHGFYYQGHRVDSHSSRFEEYELSMLSFNKMQKGDKMSGMHGNKGTISRVEKDSRSFQLKNGRTIELMLSPCGVPSRMNYGQMAEMPLSLVAEVLNIEIESPAYNGASPEELSMLMHMTYDLCNHTASLSDIERTLNNYPEVPKSIIPVIKQNWDRIKDWEGVFDENGRAELYDPESGEWLEGAVVIGCPTFNKLMQEAEEKINVRAGIMEEEYARTTSQPIGNIISAKGQRMGEMELVDMANYGMSYFLREALNEASDNPNARTNSLLTQLDERDVPKIPEYMCASRAVDNLIFLLMGVGVATIPDDEMIVINSQKCANYEELNLQKYLHSKFQNGELIKEQKTINDIARLINDM